MPKVCAFVQGNSTRSDMALSRVESSPGRTQTRHFQVGFSKSWTRTRLASPFEFFFTNPPKTLHERSNAAKMLQKCSNAPMLQCFQNAPMLQRSNTPPLQKCSNTPALQHSTSPTLHLSNTPPLQHSTSPKTLQH